MKTVKRLLFVFLIVLVLVLTAGALYLHHLKNRPVPDYSQNVDLEDLTGQVTVYRDSFGIPHIYAGNQRDLYRTAGYVMAQDRLWQMDLLRRLTAGRLAEILDPDLVDTDQLFRAMEFPDKSERVLSRTGPEILGCIEAFSDGINQYIDRHRNALPFEFALLGYEPDPWEPLHTANLIGYMSWSLASGWGPEIALFKMQQVLTDSLFKELLPQLEYHDTPVFPDFRASGKDPEIVSTLGEAFDAVRSLGLQVFQASNNWAVAGEKSETGYPLMANDMHLGLMAPGIWYQMHQVVEGELNVTGVVLPGAPFVICGHNNDIAWGMTNVGVDDTDFYLETVDPKDTNRYLLDGSWIGMRIRKEEIVVKGVDVPVTRINRYTHRGPVVSTFRDVPDHVISVRWQGREYSNELRAVYLLNRAGNWEEFRDALRTFNSISQNVVYADRYGNIGLQTAAGVPVRKGSGIFVYPGDTSLYDWQGLVPFGELPHVYNPPSGYVYSANNRTASPGYPYHIGTWFSLPYRADRIREMLEETKIHGTEDFKRMQRDRRSHLVRNTMPFCIESLREIKGDPYATAYELLADWDHDMEASYPEPLIFEMLWAELIKAICHDELGDTLYPLMLENHILAENLIRKIQVTGGSPWCDDIRTTDIRETFSDNIRTAFVSAVDTLVAQLGNELSGWEWGGMHKVVLNHPMGSSNTVRRFFRTSRGPFGVGGSFHTVCPFSYPVGRSFVADHGASQRHIFHTGNWDASLSVIPTGTSGVPASPHYLDQTELYIDDRYHGDPFSREAVESHARYIARYE